MRFGYDMVYFIFFDIMFGSIVSGLMLDAFSTLREEQEIRQTDKEDRCYICNVEREILEKDGLTFEDHTRKQHFLWNYIFYIYVLKLKDETDYTGLEYVICNQYFRPEEEQGVAWIPNRGGSEFDVKASTETITQDITDKLEGIRDSKAQLDDTVNEFKKMAREYL